MRRLFLILTVAALMAMMVAAGPAQAKISGGGGVSINDSSGSGGSSGNIDNSPVFVQSNSSIDGDIGDGDFDDIFGSGISFFGSGFDFDDSDGTEVSFG